MNFEIVKYLFYAWGITTYFLVIPHIVLLILVRVFKKNAFADLVGEVAISSWFVLNLYLFSIFLVIKGLLGF